MLQPDPIFGTFVVATRYGLVSLDEAKVLIQPKRSATFLLDAVFLGSFLGLYCTQVMILPILFGFRNGVWL